MLTCTFLCYFWLVSRYLFILLVCEIFISLLMYSTAAYTTKCVALFICSFSSYSALANPISLTYTIFTKYIYINPFTWNSLSSLFISLAFCLLVVVFPIFVLFMSSYGLHPVCSYYQRNTCIHTNFFLLLLCFVIWLDIQMTRDDCWPFILKGGK